jgi:hypothetical protein
MPYGKFRVIYREPHLSRHPWNSGFVYRCPWATIVLKKQEYRKFSKWFDRDKVSALLCDLFCVLIRDDAVPAIVIFTKFDMFVTTAMGAARDRIANWDNEKRWKYGEDKARQDVEDRCFRPWKERLGEVPLVVVSSAQSYLLILIGWMTRSTRSSPPIQKYHPGADRSYRQRDTTRGARGRCVIYGSCATQLGLRSTGRHRN